MPLQALHRIVAGSIRRTWLVVAITAIACAAFAATAVASLVEASYLGPPPRGADLPAPPGPKASPRRAHLDPGALVERNMFCSSCTPEPGPGPADSFDPKAILIATSQGVEPIATLRALESDAQGSWGVGETVPGVGRIERIGWVSVDLVDTQGRRATLSLLASTTKPPETGAATPVSEWTDRIRKIDDHTYEVDRSLVRDLVSGAAKPGGGVRVLPLQKDGVLTGLRLYGAKEGSLPAALGIKNGDILTAINNKKIESIQSLLDVYAQIDQLSFVELDGTRGDKPLAISLRLK